MRCCLWLPVLVCYKSLEKSSIYRTSSLFWWPYPIGNEILNGFRDLCYNRKSNRKSNHKSTYWVQYSGTSRQQRSARAKVSRPGHSQSRPTRPVFENHFFGPARYIIGPVMPIRAGPGDGCPSDFWPTALLWCLCLLHLCIFVCLSVCLSVVLSVRPSVCPGQMNYG